MRVLVIDVAASEGGALTILESFYKYIKDYDKSNEYIFVLSDYYLLEDDNIKIDVYSDVKKSYLNRLKFDYHYGKKLINKWHPDVIFSMQNTIFYSTDNIHQVVYMHQSIPFQNLKKFNILNTKERKLAIVQYFIGYFIKKSVKRANKVIVQTNWVKEAVIKKTKIDEEKIMAIFPDFNYQEITKTNKKYLNTSEFFYPASNEIYKNHECIYNAVDILNKGNQYEFKVYLTVNGDSSERINNCGYINHDKVFENMKTKVLIFPSYIETVGLPLLEAKLIGTIILASDTPFSHEILDDYENVYFFNPFNANELAILMKKCINKEIVLKPVSKLLCKNRNSWDKVISILNEEGKKYEKN